MRSLPSFLAAFLLLAPHARAAVPDAVIRPSFENLAGPSNSRAVVILQGLIAPDGASPIQQGGTFLSEATFGQPFATTQELSPNRSFAERVLHNQAGTGVYDILYPPGYRTLTGVTATRSQLEDPATGGAFRYKWLAFGENGEDAEGEPIILSLFAETFGDVPDDENPWFADAERQAAREQIEVLRDALAIAPLNKQLQLALLDIHYDLAMAEMQFVNKRLFQLAVIRLGLDSTPSAFIIDDEIELYREMIQVVGQAAAWYAELLAYEMSGVDPGDFAPEFAGQPYGRFVFKSRVPFRSQMETELQRSSPTVPRVETAENRVATFELPGDHNDFTITAVAPVPKNFRVVMIEGSTLPQFGAQTLAIPIINATAGTVTVNTLKTRIEAIRQDGKQLFNVANLPGNNGSGIASIQTGVADSILNPGDDAVYAGYKDYRAFITILGQLVQYKSDLARLLGLRQSPGDLSEARDLISEVMGGDSDTFRQLQNLFQEVDFDDSSLDATGVRAAFTLFKTALSDSVGVRDFLNGTANMLGLDPDFLLLVKKSGAEATLDTYDVLAQRINRSSGSIPVGALAVAVDELGDPDQPTNGGGAIQAWHTFKSSISEVAGDLIDIEIQLRDRFEEITGYAWNGGENDWDGQNPNPGNIGSELTTAARTVSRLEDENNTLRQIVAKGETDVENANNAVRLAETIKTSIEDAENAYFDKTTGLWIGLGIANAVGDAANVAQDAAFSIATISQPIPIALAQASAIKAAALANGAVQALRAGTVTALESQLDAASILYNTKLALADQQLVVQQNALQIGALEREVLGNQLQINSNTNALAQAQADRLALLREVERIEANFKDSRASIASGYSADPIHFQRAQASLLLADASFRRAQLWLFITCRALEYKWQERFSYANPQIGESLDIGSIFKARNAFELRRIYQNMEFFNDDRENSSGTRRDDLATVSLSDHVLTPNPKDFNRDFGAFPLDDGRRVNPLTNEPFDKVDHFRQILRSLQTTPENAFGGNGAIEIVIDTTELEIGQLFAGAKYTFSPPNSTNLVDVDSGLYRDKFNWIAVHFVFEEGSFVKSSPVPAIPGNNGIDGSMSYGGITKFRTRIPPYPDLSPGVPDDASDATIDPTNEILDPQTGLPVPLPVQVRRDFPGEFLVAPFRYFQNTDPSTRQFETFPFQDIPSVEYLFSTRSAETPEVEAKITASGGFQIKDFQELSVATTRMVLQIDANEFNIDDLVDIELIINHTGYVRPQISPNP